MVIPWPRQNCADLHPMMIPRNCADFQIWRFEVEISGFLITRRNILLKAYLNAHGSIDLVKTRRMVQPRAQTDHLSRSYRPSKPKLAVLRHNAKSDIIGAWRILDRLGSKFQGISLMMLNLTYVGGKGIRSPQPTLWPQTCPRVGLRAPKKSNFCYKSFFEVELA